MAVYIYHIYIYIYISIYIYIYIYIIRLYLKISSLVPAEYLGDDLGRLPSSGVSFHDIR